MPTEISQKKIEGIVKVLRHLNDGFTKVIWEKTIGVGLADGGIASDIPTKIIPTNLRKIGSRFHLKIARQITEIEEIKE